MGIPAVRAGDAQQNPVGQVGVGGVPVAPAGQAPWPQPVQAGPSEEASKGFSFWGAVGALGKGLLSPVRALFQKPLLSLAMIIGGIALAAICPATIPLLLAAGLLFSGFQLAKGLFGAVRSAIKGDARGFEASLEEVGGGVAGVGLTFLGARGAGVVAAETKAAALAAQKGLSVADTAVAVAGAGQKARAMTRLQAIGESFSLFTSRAGLRGLAHSFKPRTLAANAKNSWERIAQWPAKWREIRQRFRMSDAEIEALVKAEASTVFAELGVPQALQPKIMMKPLGFLGGAYVPKEHTIYFNSPLYRLGIVSLQRTITHEALHAQQALLRTQLNPAQVSQLIRRQILHDIVRGEPNKIIAVAPDVGKRATLIDVPPMSFTTRQHVAHLLKTKVFRNQKTLDLFYKYWGPNGSKYPNAAALRRTAEVEALAARIAQGCPELMAHCGGNVDLAKLQLLNYMKAHIERARWAQSLATVPTSGSAEFTALGQALRQTPLPADRLAAAQRSVRGVLNTYEGNARLQAAMPKPTRQDGLEYFFCKEEVQVRLATARSLLARHRQALNRAAQTASAESDSVRRLGWQVYRLRHEIALNRQAAQLRRLMHRYNLEPGNTGIQQEIARIEAQIRTLAGQSVSMETPAFLLPRGSMALTTIIADGYPSLLPFRTSPSLGVPGTLAASRRRD